MAGVRIDGDPLALAGLAPAHEAGRVARPADQAGGVEREGDRARAVVAVVEEAPVAAAPLVRRARDRVAGLDDLQDLGRRLERRECDAVVECGRVVGAAVDRARGVLARERAGGGLGGLRRRGLLGDPAAVVLGLRAAGDPAGDRLDELGMRLGQRWLLGVVFGLDRGARRRLPRAAAGERGHGEQEDQRAADQKLVLLAAAALVSPICRWSIWPTVGSTCLRRLPCL